MRHLAGFSGVLQVDGYIAYKTLTDARRAGGPLMLAFCWAHLRRRFYEIAKDGNAPIATEALLRIGELYKIEADICGRPADERRAERQERAKPLADDLKAWLEKQLGCVSKRATIADDIRYGLRHWEGLTRFLDNTPHIEAVGWVRYLEGWPTREAPMSQVTFSFPIDEELQTKITKLAKASNRTAAHIVLREIAEDYVRRQDEKAAHEAQIEREIDEAIAEADDPNTVWIPQEQVMAEVRAALEAHIAAKAGK